MPDSGRYFDSDPRPRRSPRLFAEVEDVPGSVNPASLRPSKPTPAQLDRLRRDMAIYLAVEGGMSYRIAGKAFGLTAPGILKAYRRICCRKSRV
jgi:hypothetical protein